MAEAVSSQKMLRTWYGLKAEIDIESTSWHLVRIGRLALPHPPLVNLVLRKGQGRADYLRLSLLHEFGHLQTFPIALAHTILLLAVARRRGGLRNILAGAGAWLLAHEAAWEMVSELYVVAQAGDDYRRIYRENPNRGGRLLFWGGMTLLTALATRNLVRTRETE